VYTKEGESYTGCQKSEYIDEREAHPSILCQLKDVSSKHHRSKLPRMRSFSSIQKDVLIHFTRILSFHKDGVIHSKG
jgi:hypothetical protein